MPMLKGIPNISSLSALFNLKENRLMRAGFLLTIANLMTGVLGYIYQVVVGRLLSPSEYALFSTILALTLFFGSPLNAMFMLVSRRVSQLRVSGNLDSVRALYTRMQLRICLIGFLSLFLLSYFISDIQVYLKSVSAIPIWIFFLMLLAAALTFINNAYFQAMQSFQWLGGTTFATVVLKLLITVILIILGYGVIGALAGSLIATMAIWLIGLMTLKKLIATKPVETDKDAVTIPSKIFPVVVANGAFAAMTQLDMVLVNWFFEPHIAGQYAAASVLGKAVLYLPGGLVLAMFPMVAENHAKQVASAHFMIQSVLITGLLCGAVAFIYWIFGNVIVNLFYGESYEGAGELLRWYGFAIFPMSLVFIAEHFLIAKGRVLFAWLFLGFAPIQIGLIYFWHESLLQILAIIGGCGFAMMFVGYSLLWREFKNAS